MSIRLTVFALSLAVAGCATHKDLSDKTVLVNRGVEEGANRMLLLNVLRASKHRPMHFTTITQVHSPFGLATPSLGFEIPFGRSTTDALKVSPSASMERPSLDIAVLDGEKFIRGITTPTKVATINYLLDQGWPKDLVYTLFIRAIKTAPKEEATFINNPLDKAGFTDFRTELQALINCGLHLDVEEQASLMEVDISPNQIRNVRDLVEMRKAGMTLVIKNPPKEGESKNRDAKAVSGSAGSRLGAADPARKPTVVPPPVVYALNKPQEKTVAYVTKSEQEGCASKLVKLRYLMTKDETKKRSEERLKKDLALQRDRMQVKQAPIQKPPPEIEDRETAEKEKAEKEKVEKEAVMYIRSPEAIIYYLGSIVRLRYEGHYDVGGSRIEEPKVEVRPGSADGRKPVEEKIIKIRKTADSNGLKQPPELTVEYDGETYVVPGQNTDKHRTMNVFTLITQLLGLQKEASEIPSTQTVRTIGRQ